MQKKITALVTERREEIAREREAADRLVREINAEIEELVLSTRKLKKLQVLEDRK